MVENKVENKKEGLNFTWQASTIRAIKQYLSFINPLIKDKLSPMEINVLADFIYLDVLYKSYPKEAREIIIFSKETRKKITSHLETTKDALNNTVSSLYKKGYLSRDGKLLAKIPIENNQIKIGLTIDVVNDPKDNFMLDFVSNESIQD